jgi:hypothetical protein
MLASDAPNIVDNYDILCELFKALWFFFIEGLQDRGQSLILNRPV